MDYRIFRTYSHLPGDILSRRIVQLDMSLGSARETEERSKPPLLGADAAVRVVRLDAGSNPILLTRL